MALTEREKAILRLNVDGLSDYRIARKLKVETPNVTRSRKNALKKLERAKADLDFVDKLKSKRPAFLASDT
ncbi:MAG: LuxR C-terminal-related transcriptional regulator [Candidatus Bathyarchaeota archaeon]|nr:LuxR C-terminal-related transcriptional regulator [Candidatus Bathyarchaeota archaeon]